MTNTSNLSQAESTTAASGAYFPPHLQITYGELPADLPAAATEDEANMNTATIEAGLDDESPSSKSKVLLESRVGPTLCSVMFWWKINLVFWGKLISNTSKRMLYTFSPILSRHYGVSLGTYTWALVVGEMSATLGVFLGPIGDVLGYSPLYVTGSLLLGFALLVTSSVPYFPALVVAAAAGGVASTMNSVGLSSFAASITPKRNMGLITGIVELGWGGCSILTIPLLSVAMARFHWQSPFWILSLILGVSATLNFFFLWHFHGSHRMGPAKETSTGCMKVMKNCWGNIKYLIWGVATSALPVLKSRRAFDILSFQFFLQILGGLLYWVISVWMEDEYGLSTEELGTIGIIIGVAEVIATLSVSVVSDTLGLWNSNIMGTTVLTLSCLSFSFLANVHFFVGCAHIFLIFLSMEFTIVASLALSVQTMPDRKANIISLFFLSTSLGRALGTAVAPPCWSAGGVLSIGLSAFACGLICVFWLVSYRRSKALFIVKHRDLVTSMMLKKKSAKSDGKSPSPPVNPMDGDCVQVKVEEVQDRLGEEL